MSFSCFKPNCARITAFECRCNKIPIYSCKKHIGKHQIMYGKHILERLLLHLSKENYNTFSKKAINTNNYINEAIQNIEKSSASAIETIIINTKMIIEKLTSHQKMIILLIKEATKSSEVNKKRLEILEFLDSLKTFPDIKLENIKQNFKEYYDLLSLQNCPKVIKSNDSLSLQDSSKIIESDIKKEKTKHEEKKYIEIKAKDQCHESVIVGSPVEKHLSTISPSRNCENQFKKIVKKLSTKGENIRPLYSYVDPNFGYNNFWTIDVKIDHIDDLD